MNLGHWRRKHLLPLVLGLSDGVLTALTLGAGRLLDVRSHIGMGMALRIAVTALATGAFVFFVARYAELRGELVHAEKQLNLLSHGRFAASKLGRDIFCEAMAAAVVSSISSFLGALTPLTVAVLCPGCRWAAVLVALVGLALLGVGLAKAVSGNMLHWATTLVVGGIVLCILGVQLRII
jgi:predicted membrane protein (TIGR00267 family)